MLAGAFWGFIPGFLKAVSRRPRSRHDDHAQLHRDRVPGRAWSAGRSTCPGSPSPITHDVGNAALPILLGRNGHLGILIALDRGRRSSWFLLFRTTLGFEIRTVGANPDAARYAGMRPTRLIVLTMSICGAAGRPGRRRASSSASTHHMTSVVRDDRRLRRDRGRAARRGPTRSASCSRRCCSGRCAPARPLMQIQAGIPAELVDVLQATILFFLVASPVLQTLFRLQRREHRPRGRPTTIDQHLRQRATIA